LVGLNVFKKVIMNLFILNKTTYDVDVSPEALILKPFSKILARDRSINKKKAKAELAYIYFMCDFKSEYLSTMDEQVRSKDILEVLDGLPKDYKVDKIVKDACDYYIELNKTIASVALETQRGNIHKLLENIGQFLTSEDSNDVARATIISEKVPKLIASIDELEKMVKGQQESKKATHRGNQEKSMFEDNM